MEDRIEQDAAYSCDLMKLLIDHIGVFYAAVGGYLIDKTDLTVAAGEVINKLELQMCLWSHEVAKGDKFVWPVFCFEGNAILLELPEEVVVDVNNKYEAIKESLKQQNEFEDIIVCHMEENDEPISFTGADAGNYVYSYKGVWYFGRRHGTFSPWEKLLLNSVLEFLRGLSDLRDIQTENIDYIKKKLGEDARNTFIAAYMARVYQTFGNVLPDYDFLRRLSYQHYESQDCRGTMYCFEKGGPEKSWLKDCCPMAVIQKDGLNSMAGSWESIVRKFLEICKDSDRKLILEKMNEVWWISAIVKEDCEVHKQMNRQQISVEFQGLGKWRVLCGEEEILTYADGLYYTNHEQEKETWENELKGFEGIPEESIGEWVSIIEGIRGLSHGALMVISTEAQSEAERLCRKFKGGFSLENGLELIESNFGIFAGISSIDGATLLGTDKCCYGFGAILDGKVDEKDGEGERGRGARYNSALTYVRNHKGIACAVIVSEDKEKPLKIIR